MQTIQETKAIEAIVQMVDRLGLSYSPGADGSSTLFLDGLRIQLIPFANTLRLQFKLGDLPTEAWARERKLFAVARLAAGSLANLDANRETLTISKNAPEILLFRVVAVDHLDVDQCLENLAQFVDAAEFWQRAMGDAVR